MNAYKLALEALGLPNTLVRCATGEISPPLASLEAPALWFGFPPALVPVWSYGSRPTYLGCWKHWFSDRVPTFVEMFLGSDRMTLEVARTPDQLLALACVRAIVSGDGVSPSIEKFADEVGLDDLAHLDSVTLKTGDDSRGLVSLPAFQTLTPAESVSVLTLYDGDFPVPGTNSVRSWKNVSSFEIVGREYPADVMDDWPEWLYGSEDMPRFFETKLNEGEFGCAWMCLNSSGWSIADARKAVERLVEQSTDDSFHAVASAWLSVANDDVGGY